MKGAMRNKYIARRRIAIILLLVCILGIVFVTKKQETSIFGVAGKGKTYAAIDYNEEVTNEKFTIKYEYILNTDNNIIESCKVTVDAGENYQLFENVDFAPQGWIVEQYSTLSQACAKIVSKTYTENTTETLNIGSSYSKLLGIEVTRINNHIITLSNETLYNAVVADIESRYGENIISAASAEDFMLEITAENLKTITEIDISNKGVINTSGIEQFTYLEDLVWEGLQKEEEYWNADIVVKYEYFYTDSVKTSCRVTITPANEWIASILEEYWTSLGWSVTYTAAANGTENLIKSVSKLYTQDATETLQNENIAGGQEYVVNVEGVENQGNKYYGDSTIIPTDQKYFTFTIDETSGTATITGIKDEYAEFSYYTINGTTYPHMIKCVINDNGTYITDVVIPYEYIDGNNRYVVTGIGNNAFGPWQEDGNPSVWPGGDNYGAYELKDKMFTSFTLPNTVTSIGNWAFGGNVAALTINVPSSVTNMGQGAFGGWTGNQTINCEFYSAPNTWDANWTKYSSANIVWLPSEVANISLTASPTKIEYQKGEELDLTGGKITVTYAHGATEEKDITADMVSGYDKNTVGTQEITVTYEGKTATFDVNVVDATVDSEEVTGIEITAEPDKVSYIKGEELDLTGLTIKATADAGTKTLVVREDGTVVGSDFINEGSTSSSPAIYENIEKAGITISGYNKNTVGTQELTVTYEGKTATFEVEVTNKVTGIEITAEPSKVDYVKGEDLELTGGKITITYEDGSKEEKDIGASMVSGYNKNTVGSQTVTVTYEGKTATFEVEVTNKVTGIEITSEPSKVDYVKGEDLELTGGKITITYEDGSKEEKDIGASMVSGYNKNTVGTQELTVTYEGKTATFEVEVTNVAAEISVKTMPNKTVYAKGEALDLTGGVLSVKYQDGSSIDVPMVDENGNWNVYVYGFESGKVGEQDLTVIYEEQQTYLTVEVTNKVKKIEILQSPSKTEYVKGENLDFSDGKMIVTFENGSEKEVTMNSNGVAFDGFDSSKVGTQTVTVIYNGQKGSPSATISVKVTNKVTGIDIKSEPGKTEYVKGEDLDFAGGKIIVTYEDGSEEEKDITVDMVSGYDKNTVGTQTVSVSVDGKTVTFDVVVHEKDILPSDVEKIEISGNYKTDYIVDDETDLSGMIIDVTCEDGTTATIEITEGEKVKITCGDDSREYSSLAESGIEVSPEELVTVGTQEVTVIFRGKSATFEVNVEKEESDVITTAELKQAPGKVEYTAGESLDLGGLQIELTYADGKKETIRVNADGSVDITGKDGNTVTYDNLEQAGITVNPSSLTVGDHTLEITYKNQTIELPVTITVNPEIIEVTSVTLDKTEAILEENETLILSATINPENATDKNVTWSSSDEEVAVVSTSGVVTAKKAGNVTITVTSDANPNAKATCNLTVTAPEVPEEPKVAVTGVELNKTETTIKVGEMEDLVATILPTNATNKNVLWTSSDEEIVVVDENGTVLALAEGQVTITVTTEDGSYKATCIVNAEGEKQDPIVKVTGVSLDKTQATIKVGETETLVPTILPENATNKKVTWSSSDESVATVKGGVVTAHKAGKASITVTTEDGKKTATCEVTVEAVEVKEETVAVTGVQLNKSKTTIKVGNTETLKPTITPENATNKNITWSSSDESVATVKGGVVTAHKPGKATITVTTEDGKKTATCEVTVEKVEEPSNNNNTQNNNNNTNTSNNSSNNQSTANNTNTQKPDTSPVGLPATGKGMIAVVIALIAVCGVVSFVKYKNIDK